MEAAVFAVCAVIVLMGALGVVLSRNPVHSALCLVATLFGIAVLFIVQDANFLAAVQVIVYAGAIVVLFLFVIMLLGVDRTDDIRVEPFKVQRPVAIIIGLAIVGLVGAAVLTGAGEDSTAITGERSVGGSLSDGGPDINQLAESLFSDYVFAFEVTSILLIVAVMATVILARRPFRIDPPEESGRQDDASGADEVRSR